MPTDSKTDADALAPQLHDDRVVQMWDPSKRVAYWFYQQVASQMPDMAHRESFHEGFVWDAFFAFTADARWDKTLDLPVAGGSDVYDDRGVLDQWIAGLKKIQSQGDSK